MCILQVYSYCIVGQVWVDTSIVPYTNNNTPTVARSQAYLISLSLVALILINNICTQKWRSGEKQGEIT